MRSLPASRVPDPADAPQLRWGIAAPGGIAHLFAQAVLAHTKQKLVAVGSRSIQRAERFALRYGVDRAYGSYAELMADPGVQAVYVAAPHSEHKWLTLLALEAGKPVLVEKAFARNATEASEMITAAQRAGLTLMEGMWTNCLPRFDILRQLLADGLLGQLRLVHADHGHRVPTAARRLFDPELAGGALLDIGVYPVAFANFVLGAPRRITTTGHLTDSGVDAQETMLFSDFPEHAGAEAVLSSSMVTATPNVANICGSAGRIELDSRFYAPGQVRLVQPDGSAQTSTPPQMCLHQGLCYEAAHFAELVVSGRPESPLLPLAGSLAIMRQLDEIREQLGVRYPGE
ncbi:MAG: Gfo/Idh/MocA family oxidoreductase [Bifidobacteriaceae bacterium]|jgi:predicted dehydrogenase|nr:Gfo/Idh/MocA family oxidoreductase [Bifidobacteriaceae bacterium]